MEVRAWKNLKIYTMDPSDTIYENGGVLIEKGKIRQIGESDKISQAAEKEGISCKDMKGKTLFPGLVNTHTHLYQELLKGKGADMRLEDWWPKAMAPAGLKLREKQVRAGVMLGIAEALKCAVTTVADYMQIQPVEGLGMAQLDAAAQTGIRMVYGRGYRNTGKDIGAPSALFEEPEKVFKDVEKLKKTFKENDLFDIWLAPAALWGLTYEGARETAAYAKAENVPVMMHMFETKTDELLSRKNYNMSGCEYFENSGLMDTRLLAVHSVAVNEDILNVYARHGVSVSYNPVANMYLASGAAPIAQMLKMGMTVGLGTDGAGSNNDNDLISAMKFGALLQKTAEKDPLAVTAYEMMKMSTIGGAKALHLEKRIGSIEPGKDADLFLYDPKRSPKTWPCTDEITSMVYSGDEQAVDLVMVKERILYEDGEFKTLDFSKVMNEAEDAAKELS